MLVDVNVSQKYNVSIFKKSAYEFTRRKNPDDELYNMAFCQLVAFVLMRHPSVHVRGHLTILSFKMGKREMHTYCYFIKCIGIVEVTLNAF